VTWAHHLSRRAILMALNSQRKQIAEKVKEKLTLTCPAER
jgi:hypothetical protein